MQIARQVEDEIIARGWPVGEVIGSEKELQQRFGVSRSVLREAVRLLEHDEVARMRRGPNGGLIVTAPDPGPATRALMIYLEFVGTNVAHLQQARLLLEPLAARLAAGAVTEEDIGRLRAELTTEQTRWNEWDLRSDDNLHGIIGRSSGNAVLQLFIEMMLRLTYRYLRATPPRPAEDPQAEPRSAYHARHIAITEAVVTGDASTAEIRMADHLEKAAHWLTGQRVRRLDNYLPPDPDPSAARRKLAEVVADRVHGDIAADGWQVGTVFGSEAELLDRYVVSRAVLREAVRLLEHHSVARMRRGPGGGLVIQAPDPTASIRSVALYLDHEGLSPADLRVVREAIELGAIHAVTTDGVSPESAERLRTAVERSASIDSGDVFHIELAELTGNPLLTLFLRITTELWSRHSRAVGPLPPTIGDEVPWGHARILEPVLAGDSGLAQHRMRRHLQELTAWWH